jgi:nuclear RNA export factor
VIISVPGEDIGAILRLDGYVWAGVNVSIKRLGDNEIKSESSEETKNVRNMLKGVLERRYIAESTFLDFALLGQDPELTERSVFNSSTTASKFFPAMMVVLNNSFDTVKERDAAVQSVSLANNELSDLKAVTSLSETLPQLKNLDLSNNKFENLDQLSTWKRRFHHLDQLIMTGNPIEQADPNYGAALIQWFPKLRTLNGIQVRTDEEIASRSKAAAIPFPLRSAAFQDEGGIVVTFVQNVIGGFDTDRSALAAHYYDDHSEFSYAINTSAPRDPTIKDNAEKGDWGDYIKTSRNLKKTSQLGARQHRMFRGAKAVSDVFNAMPKTKHADLAAEARRYLIEAHIQSGVPDITGQSTAGVDGFAVTIHGEFDELDSSTGLVRKKRSFDRVIIIGPSAPGSASPVRVVNDELTIRAFGGGQAFDPDNFEPWDAAAAAAPTAAPVAEIVPQLPAGLTLDVAEQMVFALQEKTRMTIGYAKDCLEQVGWNFDMALQAFESVKATLPADAFVAA